MLDLSLSPYFKDEKDKGGKPKRLLLFSVIQNPSFLIKICSLIISFRMLRNKLQLVRIKPTWLKVQRRTNFVIENTRVLFQDHYA